MLISVYKFLIGGIGINMKELKDMDLIDDFLNNALANSSEYAEDAYRIILEALFGFQIGKISIINQRTLAPAHPDMRGISLDVEVTERGGR